MSRTEKLETQLIETRKAYYQLQEENHALYKSARSAETLEDQDGILAIARSNKAIIRSLGDKMGLLESMVAESVENDRQQSEQETKIETHEIHLELHLRTVNVTEKLLNEVCDLYNAKLNTDRYIVKDWNKSARSYRYGINGLMSNKKPKDVLNWLTTSLMQAYNARELARYYGSNQTTLKVIKVPLSD